MVDYRLAPEHPFPAAHEDALSVYRALIQQGTPMHRVVITGDSAGGNLVLATLQTLRYQDLVLPKACILFSPWLDFTHDNQSFIDNAKKDVLLNKQILDEAVAMYAPNLPTNDHRVSPLFADVCGLPPSLIIASKIEILVDDAQHLHKKILSTGGVSEYIEWGKTPHAFPVLSRLLPEARKALDKNALLINHHLSEQ